MIMKSEFDNRTNNSYLQKLYKLIILRQLGRYITYCETSIILFTCSVSPVSHLEERDRTEGMDTKK